MSSDIDKIRGYNPPSEGGGGTFLKLADGESVKVRITSLPVIFQNEFKNPDGEVTISTRFAFIVWNHDIGKPQVWGTNGATYGQQIAPLLEDDEYGDWREYDVKISRTGEKAQTRYSVRPGVKRYKLEADQLTQCNNIDIIAQVGKGMGVSQVMWLSEWRELEEEEKASRTAKNTETEKAVNEAVESADEEINLEDIPF